MEFQYLQQREQQRIGGGGGSGSGAGGDTGGGAATAAMHGLAGMPGGVAGGGITGIPFDGRHTTGGQSGQWGGARGGPRSAPPASHARHVY